jgi:hypothetical protein
MSFYFGLCDNFFYKLNSSKKMFARSSFSKNCLLYIGGQNKSNSVIKASNCPNLPRAPLSCMSLPIFAQLAAHPPFVLRDVQHEVEAPRASDLRPPVLLSTTSRDHVGPTPRLVSCRPTKQKLSGLWRDCPLGLACHHDQSVRFSAGHHHTLS